MSLLRLYTRVLELLGKEARLGWSLAGVRPVHHWLRRRGGIARRPAGAPPASGGADQLFRAHHAVAADLPYRHPFRPPDEGDAERHRLVVAAVAPRFFPGFSPHPFRGGGAAA